MTTCTLPVPASMRLARWAVIALAVTIPLSTALDNVFLAILLALALFGGGRIILQTAIHNPVARANCLLFAALLLGMSYGEASLSDGADILGKYADLVFLPLLIVAGRNAATRRQALWIFLAAMLVTALLSWLVGLRILPTAGWMWRGCLPENPAIFRSSITQNMLMAYATYLFVLLARESSSAKLKWALAASAVLTVSSVLFLVLGKTGYLVLLGLSVYLAWITLARHLLKHGHCIGWKEGAGIGLLGLALMLGAYQFSPRIHERINLAMTEYHSWQPNVYNQASTAERMEFYYNTITLIKQHPLLGVGTGGFPSAYAHQVQGTNVERSTNPHNEYLLAMVQIGIPGLALLLYLFHTQWHYAARLPSTFEQDAAHGLVLTLAITSLFNSPLHDHTEGLFFAFASALLFSRLPPDERRA